MLNAAAKLYNETPKPKSKKQMDKTKKVESKKKKYVECKKCHNHNVTLYKCEDGYICKNCM